MNRKLIAGACAAALAVAAVPASGALGAGATGGTTVTVRVEGLARTLLKSTTVKVPTSGSITKGGAPPGACPAASGAGALDVATKHDWDGKYSASLKDIFITKILGESESGTTHFWEIFVDNVAANTGACEIKLKRGDQLLFAAVPAKGTVYPLSEKAPRKVRTPGAFTVKVLGWSGSGKAKPLAGAKVTGGGRTETTNKRGIARFVAPSRPGKLVLRASKSGYVRAEVTVKITR